MDDQELAFVLYKFFNEDMADEDLTFFLDECRSRSLISQAEYDSVKPKWTLQSHKDVLYKFLIEGSRSKLKKLYDILHEHGYNSDQLEALKEIVTCSEEQINKTSDQFKQLCTVNHQNAVQTQEDIRSIATENLMKCLQSEFAKLCGSQRVSQMVAKEKQKDKEAYNVKQKNHTTLAEMTFSEMVSHLSVVEETVGGFSDEELQKLAHLKQNHESVFFCQRVTANQAENSQKLFQVYMSRCGDIIQFIQLTHMAQHSIEMPREFFQNPESYQRQSLLFQSQAMEQLFKRYPHFRPPMQPMLESTNKEKGKRKPAIECVEKGNGEHPPRKRPKWVKSLKERLTRKTINPNFE